MSNNFRAEAAARGVRQEQSSIDTTATPIARASWNFWPDLIAIVIITAAAAGVLNWMVTHLVTPVPSIGATSIIPVPFERWAPNIDNLYPPRFIELIAFKTGPGGSVEFERFVNVRVLGVRSNPPKAILIAVPLESVTKVQAALADSSVAFGYQALSQPEEPTAIPTATPAAGSVYTEIATADINPRPEALTLGNDAALATRLVIVLKAPNPELTPNPTAQAAAGERMIQACVHVIAFLDKKGQYQPRFDAAKTERLLINVPSDRFGDVVYGLTNAERIWMAPEPMCRN